MIIPSIIRTGSSRSSMVTAPVGQALLHPPQPIQGISATLSVGVTLPSSILFLISISVTRSEANNIRLELLMIPSRNTRIKSFMVPPQILFQIVWPWLDRHLSMPRSRCIFHRPPRSYHLLFLLWLPLDIFWCIVCSSCIVCPVRR